MESARARSAQLAHERLVLIDSARRNRDRLRDNMVELRSGYSSLRQGLVSGLSAMRATSPPRTPARPAGRFRRKRSLQEAADLYCRTRAPALMNEVLDHCRGWAGPVARGVARNSGAESDDLNQVALMAVMRSLERYDPEVGPFEPYARVTVAGEVRHYLRATEWALRVPRRLQEGYRLVAKARDEAGADVLSEEQLGAATGLRSEDVRAVAGLRRRAQSLDSLQAATGDRFLSSTDYDLDQVPDLADLDLAMTELDEDTRRLVELYFFQDRSQRDVARELGTNQVRVSRLLNQALTGLRRQMSS